MSQPDPQVISLTPADLKSRLDRGERLVVLDVREPDERGFAAIGLTAPTVDLHVPMGEIQARHDEIRAAAEGLPVVVYCHHGVRSMVVATFFARRGWTGLHNLDGGIDAWSLQVDPEVRRY